jgi:hypothetical protein
MEIINHSFLTKENMNKRKHEQKKKFHHTLFLKREVICNLKQIVEKIKNLILFIFCNEKYFFI